VKNPFNTHFFRFIHDIYYVITRNVLIYLLQAGNKHVCDRASFRFFHFFLANRYKKKTVFFSLSIFTRFLKKTHRDKVHVKKNTATDTCV